VFEDREPRKIKSVVDWGKKRILRSQWWRQFNKFRKYKLRQKDHPHPWRDGTQLGRVCQILFLWMHINIKK
jgi:hypothetical protein